AGDSNDANDEPADGVALTRLLRELGLARVSFAFGQHVVDGLRQRDWLLATARNAEPFRQGCSDECLEYSIGAVGVAGGAMALVYGLAVLQHDAASFDGSRNAPFLAWAISADGMRGMASAVAEVA